MTRLELLKACAAAVEADWVIPVCADEGEVVVLVEPGPSDATLRVEVTDVDGDVLMLWFGADPGGERSVSQALTGVDITAEAVHRALVGLCTAVRESLPGAWPWPVYRPVQ